MFICLIRLVALVSLIELIFFLVDLKIEYWHSQWCNVCYASMDRSAVYTRPGECVTENDETENNKHKLRVYFHLGPRV